MGWPSSKQVFIAHNVKVSVQSQCKMHQENHCGTRFSHRQRAELEIRIVSENADDPYFCGRICSHLLFCKASEHTVQCRMLEKKKPELSLLLHSVTSVTTHFDHFCPAMYFAVTEKLYESKGAKAYAHGPANSDPKEG